MGSSVFVLKGLILEMLLHNLFGFDEKDTADTLAQAVNEFNETQKATRDRVDISLSKYEDLKHENDILRFELEQAKDEIEGYKNILALINFPINRPGITLYYNTAEVEEMYNPMTMQKRYRIMIDVDEAGLKHGVEREGDIMTEWKHPYKTEHLGIWHKNCIVFTNVFSRGIHKLEEIAKGKEKRTIYPREVVKTNAKFEIEFEDGEYWSVRRPDHTCRGIRWDRAVVDISSVTIYQLEYVIKTLGNPEYLEYFE